MLCIWKAFQKVLLLGTTCWKERELVDGGYFSQQVEIYLGFKMLFLEFEEKRDFIHIDRIGLLISIFSILFPE